MIEPFHAVAIFREAAALADKGRSIILSVGEPDFATPARVIDAAADALRRGETHYSVPWGIAPLREAIARHYVDRYGVVVPGDRIAVTVGASGALTLLFAALADPGDEFLMADPGYPSNRALLTFCGHRPMTALSLGDDVFVVNSFSKYYCMTGWRLGWLVTPLPYRDAIERMSQHLVIAPPTPSQWAGVAALEPESTAIYEAQRAELERRRDYVVPALVAHGLEIACVPDGAFYVYIDCSAHTGDSWTFARELLHTTGVAITPGRDFGHHRANEFIRLSYTCPMPQLEEAVARIGGFIRDRARA